MYKYIMVNPQDYRPSIEKSEVLRIHRDLNGVERAYGNFTNIDSDMVEVSQEEITELGLDNIE